MFNKHVLKIDTSKRLGDAVIKFIEEYKAIKKHEVKTEKQRRRFENQLKRHQNMFRFLLSEIGDIPLQSITHSQMNDLAHKMLNMPKKPKTVNNYFSTYNMLFDKCKKSWGWLKESIHVEMFAVNNAVERWLFPEEAERLIRCAPPYMANMIEFSLLTGLRQSNVYGLRWDYVNFKSSCAQIPWYEMKNSEPLYLPLCPRAIDTLKRCKDNGSDFVFLSAIGRPINNIDFDMWCKSKDLAAIENFRWHDLRHTWATWQSIKGVGIFELMKLGAWRDIKMPQRYAHLSPQYKYLSGEVLSFEENHFKKVPKTNPSTSCGDLRIVK